MAYEASQRQNFSLLLKDAGVAEHTLDKVLNRGPLPRRQQEEQEKKERKNSPGLKPSRALTLRHPSGF